MRNYQNRTMTPDVEKLKFTENEIMQWYDRERIIDIQNTIMNIEDGCSDSSCFNSDTII